MSYILSAISVQIFKDNQAQVMLQAGDTQSAEARDQKIGRLTQVGVQLKKILSLKSGDINRSEQQLAGAEARNETWPSNHVGINMGSDMIGPVYDVMTKDPVGICRCLVTHLCDNPFIHCFCDNPFIHCHQHIWHT